MFCWWQDCPPALEGPCRDRLPFSPCVNGPKSGVLSKDFKSLSSTQEISTDNTLETTITETTTSNETTESFSLETTDTEGSDIQTYNTHLVPTTCIVMGKEYQIGASLPHDTGNCLECICGAGAQVTCSPHQCAPPGDDINDYRPPGPRPPLSDTF